MILLKFLFKEMLEDGAFWRRMGEAERIEPGKPIERPNNLFGGGMAGHLYNPATNRAETHQQAIIRRGEEARKQKGLAPMRPQIDETTDLRSLVAKAQNEEHASKIVEFLNSHKIEARAADGAIFNPHSPTEQEGWGIYVTPINVVDAGKILSHQSIAKGLSFDPYVKSGKK